MKEIKRLLPPPSDGIDIFVWRIDFRLLIIKFSKGFLYLD